LRCDLHWCITPSPSASAAGCGACSLAASADAPRTGARRRAERRPGARAQEAQEEAARSAKRARQAPPSPREAAAGAGAGGDASEDEGAEEAATAADAAFIDDEGAPPADEAEPAADSESEDERGRAAGPAPDDEAEEEEDEFEKMFASKGRRRSGARAGASKADVDAFMGMMEAAAMTDLDANREGKPAVHKLKMLAEAEDMLGRRGAPPRPPAARQHPHWAASSPVVCVAAHRLTPWLPLLP
jgi:hypothetical protein